MNYNKLFAFILLLLIIIQINSQYIDWPKRVDQSDKVSGFLSKFQILTDRPVDNKTFSVKCVYYLKRQIDWEGLLNRNYLAIYNSQFQKVDAKNLRQFTTDAGHYKIGDNITLGFNYTFNSSQDKYGSVYAFLGADDYKNSQYILVQFEFPNNNLNEWVQTKEENKQQAIENKPKKLKDHQQIQYSYIKRQAKNQSNNLLQQ